MATRFIFGKKGSGKSYLAARWLAEELKGGSRDVVTNLAVDLKALATYIELHCPGLRGDEWKRVRILETSQLKEWYRYRGGNVDLDPIREGDAAEWGLLDWSKCHGRPSVLYIIDEAHIPFGAREFAKTGKAVLSFLSQSRKLGDEVVLVSQRPEQVDKQMRGQVDEWTHAVNFANLSLLSMFRLPKRIVWTSYASLPAGNRKEPAQARGIIKVDPKGIGSIYDTNAGVGIKGSGEPPKKSRKLSLLWLLPIPVLAWAGCRSGVAAIQAGASRLIPGSNTSTNLPPVPTNAPTAASRLASLVGITPQGTAPTATASVALPSAPPGPELVCVAWWAIGGNAKAILSDGTEWTPWDGLQKVGPSRVRIDGTNYNVRAFNTRQTPSGLPSSPTL